MADLYTSDIKFLPGVGPRRATIFAQEAGIHSLEQLLHYFPYRYIDRSRYYKIREVNSASSYVQIVGRFIKFETIGQAYKKRLVAKFVDETGALEIIWFKGLSFVEKNLKEDVDYLIFGKPSAFNGKVNIVHPDVEKWEDVQKKPYVGGLHALYPTTEKMKSSFLNSKAIQALQANVFNALQGRIVETLPAWLLQRFQFPNLHSAMQNIHFPTDLKLLEKAQQRLKFEELFFIQLNMLRMKNARQRNIRGHLFSKVGHYFNTFYADHLPFELTGAQKRVIKEIRADVGSGKQMNRLLQGDVGSGKTLVALMVMLMALDNGFQAALMAPTEILATQHMRSISEMVDGMGVKVGLLTGSTKKAKRIKLHEQLQSGELQLLIGTHALIEDVVAFKSLGLVIVDEQHRFGVAQRARLWKKNTTPPHVLVMTATPIPRTLAMTLYGDLDVSVIDELPPGRKPIMTHHFYENKRVHINAFVKKEVDQGRQVYVVYPLIKESEKLDFKNLEDGFSEMRSYFKEPDYSICMVHGKMKAADKEAAMHGFQKGLSQIMVATTVIEVGVNVPNASVMIIESAERFGLSQLHQLRGRVGRGADQSYCVLVSSHKLSDESRKRLETMVATNDGFEIAEADLKLRGPGDIEGTQQSGLPFDLKIANLARDGQLLQLARNVATEVLNVDPLLEQAQNHTLLKQLRKLNADKINWSIIS